MTSSILHLIPTSLCQDSIYEPSNSLIESILPNLTALIAESRQTGGRILAGKIKKGNTPIRLILINEHSKDADYLDIAKEIANSNGVYALVSDAGTPCVADPGSKLVYLCKKFGVRIVSHVGPNSIILALMSSGLNGQQFTFNGYLPKNECSLNKKLRELISTARRTGYTQIFMEAPYRSVKMLNIIAKLSSIKFLLSICSNLTCSNEYTVTLESKELATHFQEIEKQIKNNPTLFLIAKA